MLAYIPSIILVVWLLIEIRKFVIVSKDLRQTEAAWDKLERHREKQQVKDRSVESTPPQPDYYPEKRFGQYDYEYDSNSYPAPIPSHSRQRAKSRGHRPPPRRNTPSGARRSHDKAKLGQTKYPSPAQRSRRSRNKPLARYDEEMDYTTDYYDDDAEEVDWD